MGGNLDNSHSPKSNLVSEMMPLDRKMYCARFHESSGVIGNFEACNIVFMNDRLHLVGCDVTASVGETGCLDGLKEAFGKLVKNAAKGKKNSSTHGEAMYSALQVMNQASGIGDDKNVMAEDGVMKMGGGLGPRARRIVVDIPFDVASRENKPFIASTVEIVTNVFYHLVVH